jgi:hypothetical protein
MTFVIEKNIPIGKGRIESKYPLATMENGDSFFVSTEGHKAKNIASSVSMIARRMGIRVATRTTPEGVRVWKIDTITTEEV